MLRGVSNFIKALIIVLPNDWCVYIKYFILQRHSNVQEHLMSLDMQLISLSPKLRLLQNFSEIVLLNPSGLKISAGFLPVGYCGSCASKLGLFIPQKKY